MLTICGSGGSSKGGGSAHTPTEVKNNLISEAVARVIEVVSEGEIGGLWNGAQGILLDGTPLMNEDGTYNFKGVYYWERTGLPRQDHIPFDEIEDEVEVSAVVTKDGGGVTRQIEIGDFDAVRINLYTGTFLKQMKDTGDVVNTKAKFEIWVQPYGGQFVKAADVEIKGKTNEAYIRSVLLTDWKERFGDGPWNVKIIRLTADSEGMDVRNEITWASYTTIIYAKFEMPDTAAIGLEIEAKQFGDHIPTRSYKLIGKCDVEIPSNYDPATRQYTGAWDGTFKLGHTTNPAWIYRDLATNPRYGAGRWIGPANVDKWALYEIAKFCDEPVPNGYGGFEPRWTCTLYLQTQEEVFHVLNALSSAFVGMSYWGSGKVTMAQDRPVDVSHHASPSNVIGGNFEYSSVGLAAKCSVIFVTWNNPDLHFKPDIAIVDDPELIRRYGWKKKDYLAVGCINMSEAIRRGKMLLETEKASPEAVAFRAGLEFADCAPGAIIEIADPYYAGIRHAGRIAQGATTTQIPLDSPITLQTGETYTVSVTLPDGTVQERPVTSPAGYKTSLTIFPALPVVPQAESQWVLCGTECEPRLFRCVSNRETKPIEFEINAVLHDPTKFDRIYNDIALPAPSTGIIGEGPLPVVTPGAKSFTYVDGGNFAPGVLLSWQHPLIPGGTQPDPRITYYDIAYQTKDDPDGEGWQQLGSTMEPSYEWRGLRPGVYDFRVRARGLGMGPWGTIENITAGGCAYPVPPVTGLALKTGGTAFTGLDCEVVWNSVKGADGFPNARFKDYKVVVLSADGLTTLRTEYVQSEFYIYSYEKNLKDNGGTVALSFQIKVLARDILDTTGESIQATLTNPAPKLFAITVDAAGNLAGTGSPCIQVDNSKVSFLETFEVPIETTWNSYSIYPSNPADISYPLYGQAGGKVFHAASQQYWSFPRNIPLDPSKLYRMRVRVRKTAHNSSLNGTIVAGLNCVGADGVTWVSTNGGSVLGANMPIMCSANIAVSDNWTEYTGYYKGLQPVGTNGTNALGGNPASPGIFHVNVRYVRPFFQINNPSSVNRIDVYDIDYISLDIIPENADQIVESSTKKWAGESGATVGAKAGTNLKDSSGGLLNDAAIITSQGTAAAITGQGALATKNVIDQTALIQASISGPILAALTPTTAGLYMTPAGLGYWNGAAWTAAIMSDGKFYFAGTGNNWIQWNGSVLDIRGKLNADDIAAGTLRADRIVANSISSNQLTVGGIATDSVAQGAIALVYDTILGTTKDYVIPTNNSMYCIDFGWYLTDALGNCPLSPINFRGGTIVVEYEVAVNFIGTSWRDKAVSLWAKTGDDVSSWYSLTLVDFTTLGNGAGSWIGKDKVVLSCPDGVSLLYLQICGNRTANLNNRIRFDTTVGRNRLTVWGSKR